MNSHRFSDLCGLTVVLAKLLVSSVCAATANSEKTLVSWLTPDNLTQRGGSALTIQRGDRFDAIVFGEKEPGRWMAGSENFGRTQAGQDANLAEQVDGKSLIQVAIVYKAGGIEIYRNGTHYAGYEAKNIDLLTSQANVAVFGLRHLGAESGQTFQGTIEEARIYDRALSSDEIRELALNQPSAVTPYAWWTFEKGQETDRVGRFPVNSLTGGARIENGRLVLEKGGATLLATKALPSAKVMAAAEGGAESLEAYRSFRFQSARWVIGNSLSKRRQASTCLPCKPSQGATVTITR
jgi:hypothetical protein